jgi:hypothetical protein
MSKFPLKKILERLINQIFLELEWIGDWILAQYPPFM